MRYRRILRVQKNHPDLDGPLRTLDLVFRCCSAARQTSRSPQTQNQARHKFTVCGTLPTLPFPVFAAAAIACERSRFIAVMLPTSPERSLKVAVRWRAELSFAAEKLLLLRVGQELQKFSGVVGQCRALRVA